MNIKRNISFLLFLLIVIIGFAESNYKVISSSPLNVRAAPSLDAKVLGTFESGDLVDVVSLKKNWAKVKYLNSYGFVQTQYIEKIPGKSTVKNFINTDTFITLSTNREKKSSPTDPEAEKKLSFFELTYSAGSFENVKQSGLYGCGWIHLPWEIETNFYAGIHYSGNLNFGLSDFDCAEIRFGPTIGYYFTPRIFISAPLDVLCDIFTDNNKTKTAWGLALSPAIYIGKNAGLFLGPQFAVGFSGNSKVSCGFRTGIYF